MSRETPQDSQEPSKAVVALTGTLGCGKSTVAHMLSDLGAVVISADALARQAVSRGSPALDQIARVFGSDVISPDGTLEREKLASLVFSDPEKRLTLEKITHPLIHRLAQAAFREAAAKQPPLIIYDCPLLFETGLDQLGFRAIIVVAADEQLCIKRVQTRDGVTEEEARQRLAAQIPIEQKTNRANVVIDNSGSLSELEAKVLQVFDDLKLSQ